jgi:hypothetical protein
MLLYSTYGNALLPQTISQIGALTMVKDAIRTTAVKTQCNNQAAFLHREVDHQPLRNLHLGRILTKKGRSQKPGAI